MTSSSTRLAATVAFALTLVVAVSARSAHEPEKLNTDVVAHASDDFSIPINPAETIFSLAKGAIIAIVISVIVVIVLIVLCCVCCCKACAKNKETHTVVYSGNPPQQFPPPMHQQWPPGTQPTSPQGYFAPQAQEAAPPLAYPPAYPAGPAYEPPKKY
ncbi:hypothetical protein MRX96_014054 [Rhipicephalus microplus]|uniref:uncharacterized protein LOC119181031 n=1 Tax=Rhipicephalus microplus TaxID=6941 RepID=UPI003F6C18FB